VTACVVAEGALPEDPDVADVVPDVVLEVVLDVVLEPEPAAGAVPLEGVTLMEKLGSAVVVVPSVAAMTIFG
jgi:hypothetical protein